MKSKLLNGWYFMRFLRLGMGTLMLTQAFQMSDKLLGFVGAILLIQALLNKGCCASGACTTPQKPNQNEQFEEIKFEEIK